MDSNNSTNNSFFDEIPVKDHSGHLRVVKFKGAGGEESRRDANEAYEFKLEKMSDGAKVAQDSKKAVPEQDDKILNFQKADGNIEPAPTVISSRAASLIFPDEKQKETDKLEEGKKDKNNPPGFSAEKLGIQKKENSADNNSNSAKPQPSAPATRQNNFGKEIFAGNSDQSGKAHYYPELHPELSLQPPTPMIIKSDKPIFMFHPEDEEEVARIVGRRSEDLSKKEFRDAGAGAISSQKINLEKISNGNPAGKSEKKMDIETVLEPISGIAKEPPLKSKAGDSMPPGNSLKLSFEEMIAKKAEIEMQVNGKIERIIESLPVEILEKLGIADKPNKPLSPQTYEKGTPREGLTDKEDGGRNGKWIGSAQIGIPDRANISIKLDLGIQPSPGNKQSASFLIDGKNNFSEEIDQKAKAKISFLEGHSLDLDKFKNLLRTRIKGARNNIELWQALVKERNVGGMEFTEKEADLIIKMVSENLLLGKKDNSIPEKVEPQKNSSFPEISYKPSSQELSAIKSEKSLPPEMPREQDIPKSDLPASINLEKINEQTIPLEKEKPANEHDEQGNKNASSDKKGREEKNINVEKEIKKTEEIKNNNKINFLAFNRSLGQSGKIKIEDIKYKPKLIGPVEELAEMRLKDFRQLADSPEQAAALIKVKVDNIGEESLTKKVEAIKAWRESEIFKTYLKIGQLALAANKSIKILSEELKAGDKKYLTEEEFYAIMDLNKKLRF